MRHLAGSPDRGAMRVLLAVLLTACAVSSSHVSATNIVREKRQLILTSAECYSLRYSEPVGSASVRFFPIWMMLLPGADSGSAVGRHHPEVSDQDWASVSKYSHWKRLTSDSLEVLFTGSYEGIRIRAVRRTANLAGRATWLSDVIGPAESSMLLVGNREQCP